MRLSKFKVTPKAKRPATKENKCTYCNQPIGNFHKEDCVCISKKIKLKVTIEYETDCPADWDKNQIEFHRNEGSWCADNCLSEIEEYIESKGICLCSNADFEYIEDIGDAYLDE